MHEHADEHKIEGLLTDNKQLAIHNREHFDSLGCLVINLMSAPGAGKTSLITKTVPALKEPRHVAVIEGDMVGDLDVQRLKKAEIEAFQISTGRNCHLDASMVARLLHCQEMPQCDLIFIENVGNLVCPAEFPLGEHKRVVLLSVTEGDDKPLKYPVIFRNCDVVILTKCDLIPYVDFDKQRLKRAMSGLNDSAKLFEVSVKTGEGMAQWLSWVDSEYSAFGRTMPTPPLNALSPL